jgi:4-carboxymuconolactone decarboxylase
MLEDAVGASTGRPAAESETALAQIPLVSDDIANPVQLSLFADVAASRGDVLNVYRAMAHSPDLARRVSSVGAFLRRDSVLPARLREAVILATAAHWKCRYQQTDHEPIARATGLSRGDIEDLATSATPRDMSDVERQIVRYVRALLADGQPHLDLLGSFKPALDQQALVELHLLAGYYSMIAVFVNGLEIPPGPQEPPSETGPSTTRS